MLNLFGKRSLDEVLNQQKKVKIKGLKFTIRKIDAIHHMEGARVMAASYATYEQKRAAEKIPNVDFNKLRDHYRDVILSGVVWPKLVRNESDNDGIWIDRLFTDWELAEALYGEILTLTYGKKKMKQGTSLSQGS